MPAKVHDGDRILLRNVSWELYTELRDDPERDRVRMTYRHGVLELMSPSSPHERIKRILELLVTCWCRHHRLPLGSFGSTTYRLQEKESGLEPDSCFFIENEEAVRRSEEVDLTIQPPPDLAIEVEISHSAQSRMDIYADLGVPEVWRTNGVRLNMLRLVDGAYEPIPESMALPGLRPSDLLHFVGMRFELDETSLADAFDAWMSDGQLP
jgi:Uma2 family endonuclease